MSTGIVTRTAGVEGLMPPPAAEPEPRLDTVSEDALVDRVRSGCEASFAELDRRMRPRLIAALHRRTRSRADCEDIAQQALLQAYRQLHRYDAARRFSTWLFTIAFRLAVDAHRRRRPEASLHHPALPAPVDPAAGPAQQAMARELRRNLWAVADRVLSDVQFSALWLRYGEGLEPGEVASVLNRSAVSVRVLLHRAKRKLRPHVAGYHDDAAGPAPETEVCHAST